MSDARVPVKLVFADRGSFYEITVNVPGDMLDRHPRIIDALREEPAIIAELYIDMRRLVAAHLVAEAAE